MRARAYLLHTGFAFFIIATVWTLPASPSEDSGSMGEIILDAGLYCIAFIVFPAAAALYSLRTRPWDAGLVALTMVMFGLVALFLYSTYGSDTVPPATRQTWLRFARWAYLATTFLFLLIRGVQSRRQLLVCACILLTACSSAPPAPPEPQMLELSLGQTRRVMQGRASVWFAQPDEEWREDLNQIVEGARIEVACKGQAYTHLVIKDKPTDPVCGIRLQLLRLEEPDMGASPPRTFRVSAE